MCRNGFALILALLLVFAGAALAEQESGFPPINFSFWSDVEAGYEWFCEYDDNGVLEEPLQDFVEAEDGGYFEYDFGVNQPGKAQIIFNYGVNYSLTVPDRTVFCTVLVDESGESSVRWTERYADDHIIRIILPSNPTSGWNWNYADDPSGMVTLVSEAYVPLDPALEGAGGNTSYQLRVEKPGETVLMFDYSDMWNPDAEAAETYAVVVTANEDMEISLSIDEQ